MATKNDIQAEALNYYYGKDLHSNAKKGLVGTQVRVDCASCIPWLKKEHWLAEINRIEQLIRQESSSNTNFFSTLLKSKSQYSLCEDLYNSMLGRPIAEDIRKTFIENYHRLEKKHTNGQARAFCVHAFLEFAKRTDCTLEQYRRALIYAYIAVEHEPSEWTIKVLIIAQQEYLICLRKRAEYLQEIYKTPESVSRHQQILQNNKKEKIRKNLKIQATVFYASIENSKTVITHQIKFFYTKFKKYLEAPQRPSAPSSEGMNTLNAPQNKPHSRKKEQKIWTYAEIKYFQKNGFRSLTKEQKISIYELIVQWILTLRWFPLSQIVTNDLLTIVEQMTTAETTAKETDQSTANFFKKPQKINKMRDYLDAVLAQAEGEMRFSIHKASLIEYEHNKKAPSPPFRSEFGMNAQDYRKEISKYYKRAMENYGRITQTIPLTHYENAINFNILKNLVSCVLSIINKQITPPSVTREYLQKNELLLRRAVASQRDTRQIELLRDKMIQIMVRARVKPLE